MIFYGIVLLVIGIVVWAIGRGTATPPAILAGYAVSAIGLISLVVGIILLAVPADVRAMIA